MILLTNGPVPDIGIHLDVPEDTYRSWNAWSSSVLKDAVSPRALQHAVSIERGQRFSDSTVQSLILGSAVDARFFGVDAERYVDRPDGIVLSRKDGKEWKEKNITDGKVLLSKSQTISCKHVLDALKAHPRVMDIMDNCHHTDGRPWIQASAVAEIHGMVCKGRLDIADDEVIWDLKTTSSQIRTAHDAERVVMQRGYHLQAALYTSLFREEAGEWGFGWIFAETTFPWEVSVWEASERVLKEGRWLLEKRMATAKQWIEHSREFANMDIGEIL